MNQPLTTITNWQQQSTISKISLISQPKFRQYHKDRNNKKSPVVFLLFHHCCSGWNNCRQKMYKAMPGLFIRLRIWWLTSKRQLHLIKGRSETEVYTEYEHNRKDVIKKLTKTLFFKHLYLICTIFYNTLSYSYVIHSTTLHAPDSVQPLKLEISWFS